MIKYIFVSVIILLSILLTAGCNKSTPPPTEPPPPDEIPKDTISISAGDVTHRSISINIKSTDNNAGWEVILYRTVNGTDAPLSYYPASVNDTTIIDDDNGAGLQLDTEYKYYAALIDTAGSMQEKTLPVTAKTLAATSHNYTWQEYTFGDVGIEASILYDVWGTDENNVWAVGPILINGTWYGVLYWNGIEWLPDSTAGGYAIFGFNNNDIWTVGGGVFHFDGAKWNPIDGYSSNGQGIPLDSILFYNAPYTSIWGTSSNNLYLGSHRGKVIHWDGKKAAVEKEFSNRITDINGLDKNHILIAANNEVWQYDGNTNWNKVPGLNSLLVYSSIYLVNPYEFYVAGVGLNLNKRGKWSVALTANEFLTAIRGDEQTGEIAAVGHYSTLYHYNGIDWQRFQFQLADYSPLSGVFIANNKIFAAGVLGNYARIIVGTKQ